MTKLYITAETDRLEVASILVKHKYKVRQGSQRRAGTRSYDYFLEFEPQPGKMAEGRLYIESEEDQLKAAAILVKNKYTVRSFSQVRKGVRQYYFLEYEPNPEAEKREES